MRRCEYGNCDDAADVRLDIDERPLDSKGEAEDSPQRITRRYWVCQEHRDQLLARRSDDDEDDE